MLKRLQLTSAHVCLTMQHIINDKQFLTVEDFNLLSKDNNNVIVTFNKIYNIRWLKGCCRGQDFYFVH